MDPARGSVDGENDDRRSVGSDRYPPENDLWARIVALAKKEKLSYVKATERCVEEYWRDHDLDKAP